MDTLERLGEWFEDMVSYLSPSEIRKRVRNYLDEFFSAPEFSYRGDDQEELD